MLKTQKWVAIQLGEMAVIKMLITGLWMSEFRPQYPLWEHSIPNFSAGVGSQILGANQGPSSSQWEALSQEKVERDGGRHTSALSSSLRADDSVLNSQVTWTNLFTGPLKGHHWRSVEQEQVRLLPQYWASECCQVRDEGKCLGWDFQLSRQNLVMVGKIGKISNLVWSC